MRQSRSTLRIPLDQTPRCPSCYQAIVDDCWEAVDAVIWCTRCASLRNAEYALQVRAVLMTRWATRYVGTSRGLRFMYENPKRFMNVSLNIEFFASVGDGPKREYHWWRSVLDRVKSLTPLEVLAQHVTGSEDDPLPSHNILASPDLEDSPITIPEACTSRDRINA